MTPGKSDLITYKVVPWNHLRNSSHPDDHTIRSNNVYCLLPGNDGREILKVKNAGSKFGLNLVLDVQQHEHKSYLADQAGFKVLIHDQETPPMVEELGFSFGPGTTTFAAIRKKKVIW